MNKCTVLFNLIYMLAMTCSAASEELPFSISMNKEKVILKSEGESFSIFTKDTNQCLRINETLGITPYYVCVADGKRVCIRGSSLKGTKLIIDRKDKKEVKLTFQEEPNFQLELNLSIQKELPFLFVKSSLRNIGDIPQSIEFEWFVSHEFKQYIAQDLNRYKMPEELGVDFTCGKFQKINWATIGTSRDETWIYLLSERKEGKGLGIISEEPTSFGLRGDRFVYWGEKQGVVEEEEEGVSYGFVIVPALGFEKFRVLLQEIPRGERG